MSALVVQSVVYPKHGNKLSSSVSNVDEAGTSAAKAWKWKRLGYKGKTIDINKVTCFKFKIKGQFSKDYAAKFVNYAELGCSWDEIYKLATAITTTSGVHLMMSRPLDKTGCTSAKPKEIVWRLNWIFLYLTFIFWSNLCTALGLFLSLIYDSVFRHY